MKRTHIFDSGVLFGAMAMLLTSAVAVQAASPSTTPSSNDSQKAARLLREIKADDTAVRAGAARLDALAENSNSQWSDYDHEWNVIAPAVEDMQMKLGRLESMQSALTQAQRSELDQSKPLIAEIQSRTNAFNTLMNKPGVPTTDAKFRNDAKSIKTDADKLQKVTSAA
ncbi:MAG TPA: hypothetical protein VGG72_25880 [Bryobacteraceae bacterium]|jgi:hypothetical protein